MSHVELVPQMRAADHLHLTLAWCGKLKGVDETRVRTSVRLFNEDLRDNIAIFGRVSGYDIFRGGVQVALIDLSHRVHVARHVHFVLWDKSEFPWRPHITLPEGELQHFPLGRIVSFKSKAVFKA